MGTIHPSLGIVASQCNFFLALCKTFLNIMLDFLLQAAGIAVGTAFGSCFYGWCQARIAAGMGDPTALQERGGSFWSWSRLDPVGILAMILVRVGWPRGNIMRPQASPSPRITMTLSVLVPVLLLLLISLGGTTVLKFILPLSPQVGIVIEAFVRTLLTLTLTLLLPFPPLDGYRLLSVLFTGEIRPAKKLFFPGLLLLLLLLELLIKVDIIGAFFGPVTDGIFFFLYLLG